MLIEVGKTYEVTNRYRRSVLEVEHLDHKKKKGINCILWWVQGKFFIKIKNRREQKLLIAAVEKEQDLHSKDFKNFDTLTVDTVCAEVLEPSKTWGEEEFKHFDKRCDEHPVSSLDFLHEEGYETYDWEAFITSGVDVREIGE